MSKPGMFKKLYLLWRERNFFGLKRKNPEDIFSDVYKKNTWGGDPGTFYSGSGTDHPNVVLYIEHLVEFIQSRNIHSIVEIGCGDFTIMQEVLERVHVHYTGADIVPDLIRHHQETYGNEKRKFIQLNAAKDDLPVADMIIIRQVLQHLSNDDIQKILPKFSKYKYAYITEHLPVTDDVEHNLDKITGPHIRMRVNSGVFIDKPPFNCKNVSVLFEYRQDDKLKRKLVPAVIRTYLVDNARG
jgi:Methyltransferase domain